MRPEHGRHVGAAERSEPRGHAVTGEGKAEMPVKAGRGAGTRVWGMVVRRKEWMGRWWPSGARGQQRMARAHRASAVLHREHVSGDVLGGQEHGVGPKEDVRLLHPEGTTHSPEIFKDLPLRIQNVGDALQDNVRSDHQLFQRVGQSTPPHQLGDVSLQEQLPIYKVVEHRLQRQ